MYESHLSGTMTSSNFTYVFALVFAGLTLVALPAAHAQICPLVEEICAGRLSIPGTPLSAAA